MNRPPRILTIAHNHPSLHPGGSEIFAHDLFHAMKATGAVQAMFLACTNKIHREQKPGTNFQTMGRSADEVMLWAGHFDHFTLSQIDLHGIVPDLSQLLLSFRPDVVHFHHALLIGIEALFLVRRLLPQCRIIFTLHDYYAICANHGQMVKADSRELCSAAAPDACGKCFPTVSADKFVLREKHLKTLFSLVDQFVAPSEFLRRRYMAWGLPADRIAVIRNGRPDAGPQPLRKSRDGKRNVFGYFGNLSPFKGINVALEAAALLQAEGVDLSLMINGGMPFQSDEFKADFAERLKAAQPAAQHLGPYQAADMAALMGAVDWVVMPSVWWENAPLVIQEAFLHMRPVLCSGIGGMAEAVIDGVSGLHFRPGDPRSLADAMRRAMGEEGLWERLLAGLPPVPTMAETAAAYLDASALTGTPRAAA
ncbi:MAG: glycosyltransferase family 4 protein, partial [Magnetospirillum sp.]|nr:glycosyltransferase family 4 protein [Magnetospirillum sp.]